MSSLTANVLYFQEKKDSVMLPSLILKRLFDKLVNKRKSHHIHLDRFPLFFIFYLLLICLRPFWVIFAENLWYLSADIAINDVNLQDLPSLK